MRGLRRRMAAVAAGLAASVLPAGAFAQEGGSRAVDAPGDTGTAVLAAAGGIAAIFLLATLGRLYQKQRGLRWRFQDPDPIQEEHGGH